MWCICFTVNKLSNQLSRLIFSSFRMRWYHVVSTYFPYSNHRFVVAPFLGQVNLIS